MVADFYAMLEIDPGADRATLESALARRQPAWSSGTRNPKTKHTFQSYLDQIPEIRRVLLGDPGARLAYDAELAAARRAERDVRLDELQRLVRLRAAKGGLTPGDRALLGEQAGRLGLGPDDLGRLIEPIPPRPDSPGESEAAEPAPDVLDAVARKQIRVALDHLRRRDLYDVLGLARDAPPAEVAARADAERRRWMQKSQVTAEKTAWLEVVSHAQSHLGPPEARARYDRTLAVEAEDRLAESIAFAVRGLPRLDYGTRAALIDEAGTRGIAPDRADVLIGRGCRALGVARDGAPALILGSIEPPRYLRCRACAGVTDFAEASEPAGRAECRHCRASLRWACPACKRAHWVDEARCACGFPREHVEPLVRHFEAAQLAHRARDHAAALEHLGRVRQYAPRHAGARKGIEAVRRRMAEAEAARSAAESARAKRHLVAARAAVRAWARLVPDDEPESLAAAAEVARGLRMAEALAARARACEADDPKAARGLYEKALAVAADLAAARDGLRRCPPDPPSNLVAGFDGDRVRLRWDPPPPDGLGPVRFRVVRKRSGVPAQANDGAVVAETDEAQAEDRGVRAGESAGYAVYAVRGESCSKLGATAGPVEVLPEVADLRVEARGGEVALTWVLPDRASGVRVVRNPRRRPIHVRDGEVVEALPGGAVDRGLADDRVYHYAVFALYPAPEGGPDGGDERPSRGVAVAAVPHPPVEAIAAPALTTGPDGRLRVSWEPPGRGTVRVIRTAAPLPHAPGDRLPAATAASWDGEWLDSAADGHADDPSPLAPRLGPLPLHAGARLGGRGDGRAPGAVFVRGRPVGPPRRPGRRRPGPPPLAVEPAGERVAGGRAGRIAPARGGRPGGDRGGRLGRGIQPAGLLRDDLADRPSRPLAPRRLQRGDGAGRGGRLARPRPLGPDGRARPEPRDHRLLRPPPPRLPRPALVGHLPDRARRRVDPADRPGRPPPDRPPLPRRRRDRGPLPRRHRRPDLPDPHQGRPEPPPRPRLRRPRLRPRRPPPDPPPSPGDRRGTGLIAFLRIRLL